MGEDLVDVGVDLNRNFNVDFGGILARHARDMNLSAVAPHNVFVTNTNYRGLLQGQSYCH